uniref:Uncharacterized protein n=1 Tax=Lotharella oceanica TaxID=641309 RepID=A0A7S2TJY9_9EUKA|mmetsp:Transcript_1758/g.3321  ORF Transcript_1758/g.3321 Transcript_1758/m.3321 type:complete len:285 (+) Transcript_1758:112-966(+)
MLGVLYIVRMFLGIATLLIGLSQLLATNNPAKRITLVLATLTTLSLVIYWIDPTGELGIYPCIARVCLSKLPLFTVALLCNEVVRRLTVAAEKAREQSLEYTWLGMFSKVRVASLAIFGLGIITEILAISLQGNVAFTLISYLLAYPLIAALMAPGVMAPWQMIRCIETAKAQAVLLDASVEVQNAIKLLDENKKIMKRTTKSVTTMGAFGFVFVTVNVTYICAVAIQQPDWCSWVFSKNSGLLGNPDILLYILLLVFPITIIVRGWVSLKQINKKLFEKEVGW